MLDGEICCLEQDGRSHFYALMFRRRPPFFYAFDLLMLNGRDLRGLPLLERKRRLSELMPGVESRFHYLDYVAERGRDLFRFACERDLEGIVAKWAPGRYQTDGRSTSWLKIKKPTYPQMYGRRELFDARRDPERRPAFKIAPSLVVQACEFAPGSLHLEASTGWPAATRNRAREEAVATRARAPDDGIWASTDDCGTGPHSTFNASTGFTAATRRAGK